MLLAIDPIPLVLSSIWPPINSIPRLLVIYILTSVLFLVFPHVGAQTMHITTFPFAHVTPAILPLQSPHSIDLIVSPLAQILRPILPYVDAIAMLLAKFIVTNILGALVPRLLTPAIHEAKEPLATVDRSTGMSVDAIAAHQVVGPSTLVHVVVGVLKLAILTCLIETPIARICSTILPYHGALAMAEASNPLSRV